MEWWEQGGGQAAGIALAALGLLISGTMALWSRWTRRARAYDSAACESAQLRETMLQLRGELEQLVGSMTGRLDARMHALRELLGEARTTTDNLRKLTHPPAPANSVRVDSPIAARTHESPDPADDRSKRYSRVYALADRGLDPAQIALETGLQRGEVGLILSLRRQPRPDRGHRTEPTHLANSSGEALV
jgi:hypothetical protein